MFELILRQVKLLVMMLGMDVGGTKVLVVVVKNSRIVQRRRFELRDGVRRKKIIDIILKVVGEFNPRRIGIGVPGIVQEGRVIISPNLPSLNGFHVANFIEGETGVEARVENDANCFALGEYFRWKKDLVGITLGTGLGGGIVINGRIYHGKRDAGEFGHMTIVANGRRCTCGNRGCLEEYVSKRAFEREAKRVFGRKMSPKEIYMLAKNGNLKAKQIFEKVGKFLGIGLANIANILNPELVVIGGGISKAGRLLLKPAKEEMKRRLVVTKPKIVLGKGESVAYGAAMLWRVEE